MLLERVRVVELGTVITAPLAGMVLGDMGADVVKVERPGGDPLRNSHGGAYDATFLAYNRNKRSVVIDLAAAQGCEAMRALVDEADVFIDNLRPGGLEKLGLAPSELRARNPALVHCSITGFGAEGPYRDRPAYDTVALALSGIGSLLADPQNPESIGPTLSDNITGLYAANAILAALVDRGQSGVGRRLEVNMLHASMAFIGDAYTRVTATGVVPDRHTRASSSQSLIVRCKDGALLAVHTSMREKFWRALTQAVGKPELVDDPRFATHVARASNYQAFRAEFAALFAMRDRDAWSARLAKAGVPFAPVLNCAEALGDPQVRALEVLGEAHHPTEGPVRTIRAPVRVDGRQLPWFDPPPTLGERALETPAGIWRADRLARHS